MDSRGRSSPAYWSLRDSLGLILPTYGISRFYVRGGWREDRVPASETDVETGCYTVPILPHALPMLSYDALLLAQAPRRLHTAGIYIESHWSPTACQHFHSGDLALQSETLRLLSLAVKDSLDLIPEPFSEKFQL